MEWTVTMRGATQVSVVLLLVAASDCAVITGVSRLAFPGVSGGCWGPHGSESGASGGKPKGRGLSHPLPVFLLFTCFSHYSDLALLNGCASQKLCVNQILFSVD